MSKTINTPATIATFIGFGLPALNVELAARNLPSPQEDETVAATLLAMGCRSLDEFAASVINLSEGAIDADALKASMLTAFPNHKIGDRHGSHYLSLARKGNLQGSVLCRFQPAKSTRKKKSAGVVGIDVAAMDVAQRAALAKAIKKANPELAAAILAVPAPEVKTEDAS